MRKYEKPINNNFKIKVVSIYVVSTLLIPFSKFLIEFLTYNLFGRVVLGEMFYQYNSLLTLISSITLFIIFLNIDISNKVLTKMISFLSGTTLSVYLIHNNRFLTPFLWVYISKYFNFGSWTLTLEIIIFSFIIAVICVLIDKTRAFTMNKLIFKNNIFLKLSNRLDDKLDLTKTF